MKKRLLTVFFAVMMLTLAMVTIVQASNSEEWEYVPYGDGIELTAYLGEKTDVFVPGTLEISGEKKSVIKLGDSIFENNDSINSVSFGSGILEIGEKAFYDCDNMVCILISEELTTIGAQAFESCDSFNSVILYDSVESIGANAFSSCPKLTVWCNEDTAAYSYVTENNIAYEILNPEATPEIVVLNGITYYIMNGEAIAVDFDGSATEVVIPNLVNGHPVTELRETFNKASRLVSVVLPESIRVVGDYAFASCGILAEIYLPQSVKTIGAHAFESCKRLKTVELPSDLIIIDTYAFKGCTGLESITVPEGITYLNDYVFSGCKKLESIILPNSLTGIGAGALGSCESLKELTIPGNVKILEWHAFSGCSSLTSVTIPSSVVETEAYIFKDCTSLTSVTIEEGLGELHYAFDGCINLDYFIVPRSLNSYLGVSELFPRFLIVYEGSHGQVRCEYDGVFHFVTDGTSFPEKYVVNGVTYYADSNIGAVAVRFDESYEEVVLPSYVNGYPVTGICGAFKNCTGVTKITLPNTIEFIVEYSFYGCSDLESVVFQEGIESIGNYAFYECEKLNGISLPDSIVEIGTYAFYGCKSISEISIPEGVTKINTSVFNGCSSLKNVTLHDKITSIGSNSFLNCSSLEKIDLPQGMTTLENGAFSGCSSLKEVTIPKGITTVNSAFNNCTGLKKVFFSENVKTISNYAFNSSTNLEYVVIPKSVTRLFANSFYANTVLLVYENTYAHTFAVENNKMFAIYDGSTIPEFVNVDGVKYYIQNKEAIAVYFDGSRTTITVPFSVNGYPVTELSNTFKDCTLLEDITLPEGLKKIGNYAFYNCSSLSEIKIPNSVIEFGNYAFYGCSGITDFAIPKNVEKIGNYAFAYMGITEITIPKNITSLSSNMFNRCENLTKVVLHDKVTKINSGAFYWCTKLSDINFPDSITSIGSNAFSYCPLKKVIVPQGITILESRTFYCCQQLEEVVIPEGVTKISDETFDYCIKLSVVKLPQSLKEIGFAAFRYCNKLKSIELPENLEKLSNAFICCDSLESVVIPGSLKTIQMTTFHTCPALTSVVIEEGVETIEKSAFHLCTNLKTVYVPSSVKSITESSFPTNTILLVHENSYAHNFAIENGLLYFVLQKAENPEIAYGTEISGNVAYTDGTTSEDITVELCYDDGTLKESVVVDSNGRYSFTYAEVGNYMIKASDSSGSTTYVKVSVKRKNVFEVYVLGDTNLVLKNKNNTVSGFVTPNCFAKVTLNTLDGLFFATVYTDENGTFMFEKVPNGTYKIVAEADIGTGYVEITVYDASVSDVEIVISVENITLWGYVEIEDRDGKTSCRNWVDVSLYDENGNIISSVKSDKDGKYTFTKIPVGDYSIVATVYEMRPDKKHGYDRSHKLEGYEYISVTEPGTYQVETIVLYEENDHLTTISGNITLSGKNTPCEVILRNVFGVEIARTVTEKAKYSFKNVPDGFYYITAITEEDGMGFTVVIVRGGKVKGKTNIHIFKHDKIKNREDKFKDEIPEFTKDEAELYRDRIAEEKRFYDGLSEKEKKQVSKSYLERLNRYVEWLVSCGYITPEGVTVDRGGLVVSGDELEAKDEISFTITVEKQEKWEDNENGIESDRDFIHHEMKDKTKDREIVQYYEISMTKTSNGEDKVITSVYKDTDAMGKFRITMDIPEEYRGYKHYSVVHVHCGEVVTLTDLDDDPNTVTFEIDKFSTFAIAATDTELVAEEKLPSTDFMLFDGYQVREDEYNGLRSRFVVDLNAMPTLENGGFEVVEVGAIFASTDKLTASGDEFIVSKGEDGTYKTVSYGVTVPVMKNGAIVGKYISKTENELVFACTITNFNAENYNKNVSSRGYAVLADADGNEYVVYCDYEFEEYRSVSLEMICDALFEAGEISTDNISYNHVVAFRKED
ncbi:MAG: leucine-rich repeat protein [Clostridia bacterium]|nr:leucine-rich repeat protein [Clostridia bacterium]